MKFNTKQFLKQPERLFLVISLFFGIVSAFTLPILTGPDEGAHFWVSYSMFTKNKQIPQDLLVSAEDSVKEVSNGNYINDLFGETADLEGDDIKLNYTKDVDINSVNDSRQTSTLDITHLPQALGILLGRLIHPSVGVMVLFGRLANLAVYVAAIYFVIKYVRYGKLAFVFIALFPMMIQQAGSLSYDVMNMVAIFAWVGLMINLSLQKTRLSKKQVIVLVAFAILLVVNKRSNIILFAILPFLSPNLYCKPRVASKVIQWKSLAFDYVKKFRVLLFVIGALVAVGLLFLFDRYLGSHGIGTFKFIGVFFNTFFRPEVNGQLDSILTSGIVGNFAWLWYRLPAWVVFLQLSVLALVLLGAKTPVVQKRFAVICGSTFILSILGITIGMYFQWTLLPFVAGSSATYIQGMQGRYFTPLLILLIPVFGYLKQFVAIKINQGLLTKIVTATAAFSLTTYVILTYIFFYTPADGVKDILLK